MKEKKSQHPLKKGVRARIGLLLWKKCYKNRLGARGPAFRQGLQQGKGEDRLPVRKKWTEGESEGSQSPRGGGQSGGRFCIQREPFIKRPGGEKRERRRKKRSRGTAKSGRGW